MIVLAPAYSGASTVRSLLECHPDLACTSGTGLLPLCELAMATWRNADCRPNGIPSSLATATTRALATVAAANTEAAQTFLRLYPQTQFLCLYRACPEVIRAVLSTSPWGITDAIFAPFTTRYPANTVSSLTAYWVTATGPLLAFERAHPRSCLRVRFEDLAGADSLRSG